MADKVVLGTIKMFDSKQGRGVIVPQEISNLQSGQEPVYFETPERTGFQVGQLVSYLVDPNSDRLAKDVAVLSELGE